MTTPGPVEVSTADLSRTAEAALKRLGYARIPPVSRDLPGAPEFWVQESGVPRRTFPVFVEERGAAGSLARLTAWAAGTATARTVPPRAIVVVPSDGAADEAWRTLRRDTGVDPELAILVVPPRAEADRAAHWHAGTLPPRDILRLATGIVVGLFRQAQADGSSQIDFTELLGMLRQRFGVDVHRSLGVASDEDALFLLYQLAVRDAYAPGDPGANLHLLVVKPAGPAARLPWFAA